MSHPIRVVSCTTTKPQTQPKTWSRSSFTVDSHSHTQWHPPSTGRCTGATLSPCSEQVPRAPRAAALDDSRKEGYGGTPIPLERV